MPGSGSGSGVSAGDLTVKWASGVSSLQDFLVLHPESDGSDQTAFSELLRGVFFSCFFVPLSILSLPCSALSTETVSLISIKCIVWYSGLTDIFNLSNCCINICVNDSFELVTAASLLRLWDSWTPPQPSSILSTFLFNAHFILLLWCCKINIKWTCQKYVDTERHHWVEMWFRYKIGFLKKDEWK